MVSQNGDASSYDSNVQKTAPVTKSAVTEERTENDQNTEGGHDHLPDNVFRLTLKLPHEPFETQIMVSTQEAVQDIRQAIVEFPYALQYSCFHLEHNGKRINDFIELSEVPDISADSELALVEDPYTEREARIHVVRTRELLGLAGDRADSVHGILSGLSLLDDVSKAEQLRNGSLSKPKGDDLHPIASFDLNAPASISSLCCPPQSPAPKPLKSLSLSQWNPPPHFLRIKGHLIYLHVITNEGDHFDITSAVNGFSVNSSSNSVFDPSPRPSRKDWTAHSLLTLLSKISPSFESTFQSLQDFNNKRDPLTTFQLSNAIPASPWVVPVSSSTLTSHQADITRNQEGYLMAGTEGNETLRDWNEEFQSTRELPRDTVHERVQRERISSKLFADYNEAAARGAVLVARDELTALNPTEAKDAQIFVYNNVFFSFGADGVGTFTNEGGDEAARIAVAKDVMGVKAVNQLDIAGLYTPGTVVVDYVGRRIVAQSIVPGIFKQREPGENQIDYGGGDGKDIIADNDSFAPLFEQIAKGLKGKKHPVWDKNKQRHELEASVETKGLLGTDGRRYVLDLYRVTPLDIVWLEKHWSERDKDGKATDETKIYPHRMATLRPELVEAYWKAKLRDFIRTELEQRDQPSEAPNKALANTKGEDTERSPIESASEVQKDGKQDSEDADNAKALEGQRQVDVTGFTFGLNPDVFSGQTPHTEEEQAYWAKDEAEVRSACNFLATEIIPRLVQDLKEGEVGFPLDGQSLSSLLHKRGINIRHIGEIAKLADQEDPRLQALKELIVQEMVCRGFKHIANRKLRSVPYPFAAACISHLLNCLLGSDYNPTPLPSHDSSLKALYPDVEFGFETTTPETLRAEIAYEVKIRFSYDISSTITSFSKPLQTLRRIALQLGLQLRARDYKFGKASGLKENGAPCSDGSSSASETSYPHTNGQTNGVGKRKNKKKGANRNAASPHAEPAPALTFTPEDIVNIVPVVKEASPRSSLAEEAFEAGRISLAQDQRQIGQDLLLESLSLHEQIYGIIHPEVARAYYQLSNLYYGLDEKNIAVELARKAVVVSERTLGIDNAETVLSYLNLSLQEHSIGNSDLALRYVQHALELWKIIYGHKHPDSITTINNAAVMLQSLKRFHESRQWFEASLAICEEISGKQSINTATLLFQLAQALTLDQDTHGAVNRMRNSYNIFKDALGPEDRNTKEAELWLEQLTQTAVSQARLAKDMQARRIRRGNLTPRVTLGTRLQPRVGQSPAEAISGTAPDAAVGLDNRSIEELLKYIEGESPKKTHKKRTTNPKRRTSRAQSSEVAS